MFELLFYTSDSQVLTKEVSEDDYEKFAQAGLAFTLDYSNQLIVVESKTHEIFATNLNSKSRDILIEITEAIQQPDFNVEEIVSLFKDEKFKYFSYE